MNSYQRRKFKKKQEFLRRSMGRVFTAEDANIHRRFFNIVRKLLNIGQHEFWYSVQMSSDEQIIAEAVEAQRAVLMRDLEKDIYWSGS